MNPVSIIIGSEFLQLVRKVHLTPEQNVIQILASNRSDQAFDKWMRDRHIRDRFNFLNIQYPQIRLPAVKGEQRIVIRAEALRNTPAGDGAMEHSTERGPINVAGL